MGRSGSLFVVSMGARGRPLVKRCDSSPPSNHTTTMELSPKDLEIAISSFLGVMFAEVVVKPVAIRLGKYLIRSVDGKVKFLPDWLYNKN